MKSQSFRVIGFALVLTGVPVLAHHAFSAEFDSQKPVMLNGRVAKVEWLNPHARVYIEVKGAAGAVTTWELQLASPNVLMRQGWSRDSIKRGDVLTVNGTPVESVQAKLVGCLTALQFGVGLGGRKADLRRDFQGIQVGRMFQSIPRIDAGEIPIHHHNARTEPQQEQEAESDAKPSMYEN